MSETSSAIRDYWNRHAGTETIANGATEALAAGFREHPVWLGVLPLLLDRPAGGRPLRRIADLGCGTGIVAEQLARLGYDVIAVEFAETRAALARRRLGRYPGVEVRIGDAGAPPLEIGEVDAVVSRNLLWLLPEPVAALQSWARLVGPNGRVAAVDATRRLSRQPWARLALPNPRRRGAVAPFADLADPADAAALWCQGGLADVRLADLSWVSAVKRHGESLFARLSNRSRYYAVLGDAA